ncbi:MAG TPA: phosphoglycerate dehydrogenase [Gemmatimonadaceae bacterium]|nr:phosphoglycerate dehydrogenase [Gemmatimonadaceae bacterium]
MRTSQPGAVVDARGAREGYSSAAAPAATFRVLVADRITADGLSPLRDDARFEVVERPGLAGAELARAIQGVDAVLVRSATRITRESLALADRLTVIGRAGVGVDTIDVDAATERGIAVLTAPSGNTTAAAELTMALLLAVVRRVAAADRSMRAGEWSRERFTGTELRGKTLGLLGAGRIGSEVAKRCRAFGMRVVAYDPFLTPERAHALEMELMPLEGVLAAADAVSVHVPLTDETAGLVGKAELARMKPTAVLLNVARGGVVDEAALVEALGARTICGAGLDVYEHEPLPANHPLRALDNVVLTPHLGASTAEAQHSVALEIAEAVRAALLDGDLSRAVNAPAVGGEEMRRLRPTMELAERLGRMAAALAGGAPDRVVVRYSGARDAAALRPLSASALAGVLSAAVGRATVNLVNARHLADARGVRVEEVRAGPHGAYAEYVEVEVGRAGGSTPDDDFTPLVAGALLGEGHPRVVAIDGYHVDVVPRGTLVVIRNRDVPGVIGRVGTVLGEAGLNIAEYHQARHRAGGDALAAVSVDGRLEPRVVDALRAIPEVIDVRQAQLD